MQEKNQKLSVLIMASVRWYNASAHYAFFLAEHLKGEGFNVALFGIPGSPLISKARDAGIDVIDGINLTAGPFSFIRGLFMFRRIVSKKGYNIVHPHLSRDHNFAYISLLGKRVALIRTRSESPEPGMNPFNRYIYRKTAKHYTVPSQFMVPVLKSMGIGREKITAIPLGIDYKSFSDYTPKENPKKRFNISEDKIVVSYIGRLHAVKGVEYFIRSYSFLEDSSSFHFIVSGEEIDIFVDDLKKLGKGFDAKNVTFLGRLDDVREILSVTDIGVIPSVGSEAICRVALEMFSFGIPVIGSNVNSVPESISQYEGIIINPGRPEEIAEAIERMADNELYKKMSKKIRLKLYQASPELFVKKYVRFYKKIL